MNIKLDEHGERIQTFSNLQGRVVSKDGIMYDDASDEESDDADNSHSVDKSIS